MAGKGLLITHNDADGVGCALVARMMNSMDFDIKFCNTGNGENNASDVLISTIERLKNKVLIVDDTIYQYPYNEIWVTDVSLTDGAATKLDEYSKSTGTKIMMVDHHPTNKLSEKYDWVVMADTLPVPNLSAAAALATIMSSKTKVKYLNLQSPETAMKIANETLYINTLGPKDEDNNIEKVMFYKCLAYSKIIADISRYDTWEWKTNPINYNHYGIKEDFTSLLLKNHLCVEVLEALIIAVERGILYREVDREEYHSLIKGQNKIFASKMKGLVLTNNKTTNDLFGTENLSFCMLLCTDEFSISSFQEYVFSHWKDTRFFEENGKYPDIIVGIYLDSGTISLRTKCDDINVGEIVTKFGGGGHQKAAGAKLSADAFMSVFKEYYDHKLTN